MASSATTLPAARASSAFASSTFVGSLSVLHWVHLSPLRLSCTTWNSLRRSAPSVIWLLDDICSCRQRCSFLVGGSNSRDAIMHAYNVSSDCGYLTRLAYFQPVLACALFCGSWPKLCLRLELTLFISTSDICHWRLPWNSQRRFVGLLAKGFVH